MKNKIFLLILIWLGLPAVLYLFLPVLVQHDSTPAIGKPVLLFVLYSGFSWSVALMAFAMESSRRQLFQQTKAVHSALRLGAYGTIAVLLALFTSPQTGMLSLTGQLIVIILVYLYGGITGYIYQRCRNSN